MKKNKILIALGFISTIGLSVLSGAVNAQLAPVIDGYITFDTDVITKTTVTNELKLVNNLCLELDEKNAITIDSAECFKSETMINASKVILPSNPKYIAENALIFFNFDSEYLPYQARKALDTYIENAPKDVMFRVEAAADFLGNREYNQLLSDRRARAIANYLLQKENVRVSAVIGLGETEAKLQKVCKQKNKDALISCVAEDRFGLVSIENSKK